MKRIRGSRSGLDNGVGSVRACFALAAVVLLGVASGCGKKGDSAQSDSAPDTVQSEQPVAYDRSMSIVDTTRPVSDSVVLAAVFGSRGSVPVVCDSASHPDDEYGYDRPNMWHVHWKPSDEEYKLLGLSVGEADSIQYARVVECRGIDAPGTSRVAVLIESVAPYSGCHACAPSAMAVLFESGQNDWVLLPGVNYASSVGSYGKTSGEIVLVQTGPQAWAWSVVTVDGNQGYMYTSLQLIALPPDTQGSSSLIEIGGSNEGACGPEEGLGECWDYTGEFGFSESVVVNGHYVLNVLVTGTADSSGDVRAVNRAESWRWGDGAWSKVD